MITVWEVEGMKWVIDWKVQCWPSINNLIVDQSHLVNW